MRHPPGAPSYGDRLFLFGLRHRLTRPVAQRALQQATRLLALAMGDSLRELRDSPDPLAQTHAQEREHRTLARLLAEVVELLGSRLDKLPERRRPHYTPHQRWRILELRKLLALSADETARLFRVSKGTVFRWELEAARDPQKQTVGSLLLPVPPLRRYADVVHHLVQTMDRLGFGGAEKIAATLAPAGWRLCRETVRRYRHQPPTHPKPCPAKSSKQTQPLRARRPNDLWFLDITQVKALFGFRRFRVAAVLDAFSRTPLAMGVFVREPTASDLAKLLVRASRRHGKPRLFVSDRGSQFTAGMFRRALGTIPHRFGAVGRSGSIALIERFWKTLKKDLHLPFFRPLTPSDLEERLGYAILHYTFHRPHRALGGATPAEAFFGWPRSHERAISPPRGAPGHAAPPPPFQIAFLDPQQTYPILINAA
jgi:transposase InsO family protein